MKQSPLDLWGEVIVTHADIEHWLICVPRINPESRHAIRYALNYNVASKVARAKLDGSFELLRPPGPPGRGMTVFRLPWAF
jgi:hypothetical protein